MKTIAIITGTRAEYGLLFPLMKEMQQDPDINLKIIVTGMHLSDKHGLTYRGIEKDGFHIDKKVEMSLDSDTSVGISRSIGLGIPGFSEAYKELSPDLIMVLGDRFEVFSAVIAAMVSRIPVAHIGGGDSSEGSIDEAMRHSITKMAHLHFTMNEDHRERVIQLGEHPESVFTVGSLGVDNIKRRKLLGKKEFEKAIKFSLAKNNIIVTFHPCTLEKQTTQEHFEALLNAVDELPDTHIIFTKPNADMEGRYITQMIDAYVEKNKRKSISFVSMGMELYFSALQFVDGVVGNSSSGIVEAPSFHVGTVNIGDRQKGRIRAKSVIDCALEKSAIQLAIKTLYSEKYKSTLSTVINPYGEGGAAVAIKEILKKCSLKNVLKKEFYTVDFK